MLLPQDSDHDFRFWFDVVVDASIALARCMSELQIFSEMTGDRHERTEAF
jgi:hypothetical protein